MSIEIVKMCYTCKMKPVKYSYASYCHDCLKNKEKSVSSCPKKAAHRAQVRERARVKRDYGLTLEEYRSMIDARNGLCDCCGKPSSIRNRGLSLDHCHETNKIRGVICNSCNLALGHAKDSIETLKNLICYLEKHN